MQLNMKSNKNKKSFWQKYSISCKVLNKQELIVGKLKNTKINSLRKFKS